MEEETKDDAVFFILLSVLYILEYDISSYRS
jgi:hypothetical protein